MIELVNLLKIGVITVIQIAGQISILKLSKYIMICHDIDIIDKEAPFDDNDGEVEPHEGHMTAILTEFSALFKAGV